MYVCTYVCMHAQCTHSAHKQIKQSVQSITFLPRSTINPLTSSSHLQQQHTHALVHLIQTTGINNIVLIDTQCNTESQYTLLYCIKLMYSITLQSLYRYLNGQDCNGD